MSNIEKNIELYTVWLKRKGVYPLWLSYDGDYTQFVESEHFIKFDGDNLGSYAYKNKLRLADVPNCPVPDLHLSLEGHNVVADIIYQRIKNLKTKVI